MNEASVKISLTASEAFIALMNKNNFTQRGRFSWSLPTKDNGRNIASFLKEYSETFLPNTMISGMDNDGRTVEREAPNTYYGAAEYQYALNQYNAFCQTLNTIPDFKFPSLAKLDFEPMAYHRNYNNNRNAINQNVALTDANRMTTGGVTVEIANNALWVRLFPVEKISKYEDRIHMPKVKNVKVSKENYMPPRTVNKIVKEIEESYGKVLDSRSDAIAPLLKQAEEIVTVGYSANAPATVLLTVGNKVKIRTNNPLSKFKPGVETKISITEALDLEKKVKTVQFLMHPALTDIAGMTKAKTYRGGDKRLKPYQRQAVGLHLSTKIGYLQTCSPGMGKGHPLSTKVLTPTGWKQVGDLEVGNEIFGSDGKATIVTGVFPRGKLDVFKVSFNDGSSVIVDGDHLWAVQNNISSAHGTKDYEVASTRELAKNLHSPDGTNLWRIPMVSPIQYSFSEKLVIPAYTLGTNLKTEFIPETYLRAKVEDRVALLQGLMDTGGHFDTKNGHLRWETVSKKLMEGMAEIVESLGGSVRRTIETKLFTNVDGTQKYDKLYYSLTIVLPENISPFRSEQKLVEYSASDSKPVRVMVSIEPVGQEEVRCISVAAENRLYVTEHHIVTHNTVIQLTAMKAKAENIPNYRGLIICEANVRDQWVEEAEKWFPEATTVIIEKATDIDKIADALAETGPVLIIASYSHTLLAYRELEQRTAESQRLSGLTYLARLKELAAKPVPELTLGSILLDSLWDDLCADEAVIIRNGTSKQSSIMWVLRKNSSVATALTATPINKSPDDIARLISWVRNDRNLFTGKPLSEQYDTSTEKGAKDLFKIFGPLVFRRDTSEISDEMPSADAKVHLLTPSPAEKALAFAAEKELKRCYLELVAALDEVEKTGTADKDELKKAKENLRAANGAWLGGTQLARMATSDAHALLQSESVGAALLAGQGLIDEALKNEPTKRAKFINIAQQMILDGKQLVVFTEFATVATVLVEALQNNGINAKAYTGANPTTRDRARKEFQAGDLDILVCTKAAERGLTLHKASAIVHYDLPWTLERIIQRTGRGIRIGSTNDIVEIIYLIMEGTIEQRMAENLVGLGMSASLILDHSRGVELKKTETAIAMSGLMTTMAKVSDNKNLVRFGEILLGL